MTIWNDTKEKRLTQLVFCDLSTPKPDGFNVYDDLRNLLISMGIPENEVQFIHSANTEVKKAELFAKVRSGDVRVLMGSTGKMGAGTNVQRLLVATHHLDCGWKPSDIEQRNLNEKDIVLDTVPDEEQQCRSDNRQRGQER